MDRVKAASVVALYLQKVREIPLAETMTACYPGEDPPAVLPIDISGIPTQVLGHCRPETIHPVALNWYVDAAPVEERRSTFLYTLCARAVYNPASLPALLDWAASYAHRIADDITPAQKLIASATTKDRVVSKGLQAWWLVAWLIELTCLSGWYILNFSVFTPALCLVFFLATKGILFHLVYRERLPVKLAACLVVATGARAACFTESWPVDWALVVLSLGSVLAEIDARPTKGNLYALLRASTDIKENPSDQAVELYWTARNALAREDVLAYDLAQDFTGYKPQIAEIYKCVHRYMANDRKL